MNYDLEKHTDTELKDVPEGYTKDAWISKQLFDELSSGERATFAQNMVDDVALYKGAQFSEEEAKSLKHEGWIPLSDYEATACIDQKVAALTSKQPKWTASGRENDDGKDASFVADLMAYIWDISRGNVRLKASVRHGEIKGMMAMMPYFHPYADDGKGEILIKEIDPEYLYISHDSTDPLTKDATHKMISVVQSGQVIQAQYEGVDLSKAEEAEDTTASPTNYDPHDVPQKISDIQNKKYRVIDRYSKILIPMFNVWDPYSMQEYSFTEDEYIEFAKKPAIIETSPKSVRYITEDNEVERQFKIIEEFGQVYHYVLVDKEQLQMVPGVEDRYSIPQSTVQLEVVTCGQLLEEGRIEWNKYKADRIHRVLTVGNQEVENKILNRDTHPIVTQMFNHLDNPFPMSTMRKVKDYVKQLIFYNSMLIKHTSRSTNVTLLLPKGAHDLKEIKAKLNSPSVEVIETDLELQGDKVHVIVPQQLANELFNHIKELKYQIQRIIGSYEASDGSIHGAHPTKGGLLAQDEMRMRRAEDTRKSIEEMLNELGNVVTQMIPEYYTERKAFKIAAPNGKTKEVVINDPQKEGEIFNDTFNFKYNIQIVSGSMKEVLRWGKHEELIRLWELKVLRDEEPILRSSEVDNVEEIIAKQDRIAQLEQALQQREEYIKQLEGDAQTAQRALKTADRQVANAKHRADLSVMEGDLKSKVGEIKGKLEGDKKIAEFKINNNGGNNGN
jgi:hypothetical protein